MALMQAGVFINITDVKGFRGYWPEQKCVDGKNFMQLSKRDRGLARVVLGRGICTSESQGEKVDMNLKFFDDAAAIRTAAYTDALKQASADPKDDDAPINKKRKLALSKHAQSFLPSYLPMTFPTTTFSDDSVEMPKTMNVLFGKGLADVWIEMLDDNFNYVVNRLKDDVRRSSQGRGFKKTSKSEASDANMETPKKTPRPADDE